MNRNDVIDVLSAVGAATRRTIGQADVEVWTAVIGDDDKQLALRAIRDHLRDQPGVWLEPGHVHQLVRSYQRDEIAREPRAVREARLEALAFKAAEDRQELDERRDGKTSIPSSNPLTVACPWCKAVAGHHCWLKRGYHPARVSAAEAKAGANL